MRTTLILPDDLYREVKRTAAATDRTMTSFVEEALRAALARQNTARGKDTKRYRVGATGVGGLQPGVDLTDTAALLDVMEGR
jgi:metal-responsive CopG/Arc/MetJ family transcriptional regulator